MKPLGRPVNNQHQECDNGVTSSCVIWDGPNISMECLGVQIYQGDSITPILYNTFKNFCNLLEISNIKGIDSTCVFDLPSPPDTIAELLNIIIEKVCDENERIDVLENKAELAYSANLPYCMQIISDTITITKLPLDEYLETVSVKLCQEIEQLEPLKDVILDPNSQIYTDLASLDAQITAQCSTVIPNVTQFCTSPNSFIGIASATLIFSQNIQYTTTAPHGLSDGDLVNILGLSPNVYNLTSQPVLVSGPNTFIVFVSSATPPLAPATVNPGAFIVVATSIPVEEAYAKLEKAFCSFVNFTGTPSELQAAILRDCPNMSNLPRLSNSGYMKDIYGWIDNPINAGQSMNNLWLTLCDMRSAVRNILRGCCSSSPCFSFDIGFVLNPDPNNVFVEVIFQQLYTPPLPYPPYYLSYIIDISRTEPIYVGGAVPGWMSFNFPDLETVKITISDGTITYTEDTGLTIMQLMSYPLGTGYILNYPVGFDFTAPMKSVNVSFDYSYTNLITNVTSVGTQVTYTTATDHVFQVGDKVDIYGVTPSGYNLTNAVIVGPMPASNQFTVVSPFYGAAYVIGGGAILSYNPGTTDRNCERGKCCCTFSLTNGLY
jgi:hypothetical protein